MKDIALPKLHSIGAGGSTMMLEFDRALSVQEVTFIRNWVVSQHVSSWGKENPNAKKAEHCWTCFHCGETFTTTGAARDHFGADPSKEPGCMIRVGLGAERGLLMKLRQVEEELAMFYQRRASEDADLHREIHHLQSRHSDALQQAEELGYERGLRANLINAKPVAWQIRTRFTHQNNGEWTAWLGCNAGEVGRMRVVAKMQPENYEMRALGVIEGLGP